MAKILIDARKLHTSTGRYARELLMQLEKIDTVNQYIVLAHTKDFDPLQPHSWQPTSDNFEVLECNVPHYSFREQGKLKRIINKQNVDLVHFWMPQQPRGYKGLKITTVHDLNYVHQKIYNNGILKYEFKRQVYKWFLKRIAKSNDAIITPTKWVKNDLVKFTKIDPDKVHAIHEGVTKLPKTPKRIKNLVKKDFLLYVGQSSKYKGQKTLIQALQELRKTQKDLQLAIVGRPNKYTQKLQKLIHEEGYRGVQFLGFVEDDELLWLYKNTKAYVQSSKSEGFGLMNLEAMRYGAPVVSSNASCLPEVCGDAAHYFDPNRIEDMARAINDVLTDKKLRRTLKKAGDKQYQKYSWHKMAKQTLEVYTKVLDTKNPSE